MEREGIKFLCWCWFCYIFIEEPGLDDTDANVKSTSTGSRQRLKDREIGRGKKKVDRKKKYLYAYVCNNSDIMTIMIQSCTLLIKLDIFKKYTYIVLKKILPIAIFPILSAFKYL